jgi:hypothetical protein
MLALITATLKKSKITTYLGVTKTGYNVRLNDILNIHLTIYV